MQDAPQMVTETTQLVLPAQANHYGTLFAGEALSIMQAVKLKEIAAKAKGEKKPFPRRPKSYAED